MSDYFSGAVKDGDSSNLILSKIWYWMFKNWQASSGQSGSVATVTPHSSIHTGAGTIPANSKGWTFTVLTGPIASFNGAASLPAGFSDSDPNPNAVAISYDATGGTAYVRYNS